MNEEIPNLDVRIKFRRGGLAMSPPIPYVELQCIECNNWVPFHEADLLTQAVLECSDCDAEWTIKGERVDE